MKKKEKIIEIVSGVLSLLLAVGVMTVFKACGPKEDGTWMNCHNVQHYVFYAALFMSVISIAGICIRGRVVRIVLDVIRVIAAVVTMLLPGTIMHMCMMKEMRCYMYMQPFVRILSILIAIVSAIGLVIQIKNKNA